MFCNYSLPPVCFSIFISRTFCDITWNFLGNNLLSFVQMLCQTENLISNGARTYKLFHHRKPGILPWLVWCIGTGNAKPGRGIHCDISFTYKYQDISFHTCMLESILNDLLSWYPCLLKFLKMMDRVNSHRHHKILTCLLTVENFPLSFKADMQIMPDMLFSKCKMQYVYYSEKSKSIVLPVPHWIYIVSW